jgi:DNA recombination protein RmuC
MSTPLIIGLGALLALLGAAVGYLAGRGRSGGVEARLAERTEALAHAREEASTQRQRADGLDRALATERAERTARQEADAEKIRLLRESQEQWLREIDALSRKALDQNSKSFIELARGQFEKLVTQADERGEQRRLKFEKLVEPLGKSLEQVQTHLSKVEEDRTKAYASLTEQVKGLAVAQKDLQKEASNLVKALRKPNVRGRWGEVQLRRVVELAGMEAYCDFDEQQTIESDAGRLRPDLIVRIPGDRIIVVDAKAPLEAYLDSVEAETDAERDTALGRHASQIRTHIRALGQKAYFDQFDRTPDLVVLFLPGESFFYAAAQADSGLVEFSVDNNVVIATPMTLVALLRAVAYGWRQEQVAQNAREISQLGQELYDRICIMADHFSRVGSSLNSAVGNFNKAVGSLESRVLVSARRFRELGSGSSRDIAGIESVDSSARELTSTDLRQPPRLSLPEGGDGSDGETPEGA